MRRQGVKQRLVKESCRLKPFSTLTESEACDVVCECDKHSLKGKFAMSCVSVTNTH